jgi:hypothetical protein
MVHYYADDRLWCTITCIGLDDHVLLSMRKVTLAWHVLVLLPL